MSSSNAVALKQPSSGAVALSSSQRVRKRPVKKALEEEEFTEVRMCVRHCTRERLCVSTK